MYNPPQTILQPVCINAFQEHTVKKPTKSWSHLDLHQTPFINLDKDDLKNSNSTKSLQTYVQLLITPSRILDVNLYQPSISTSYNITNQ